MSYGMLLLMMASGIRDAAEETAGNEGENMTNNIMRGISINPTDFATLAICAIRYCHGRQTYMPSLVQGIVRPHLTELEDRDLAVLLQDCEGMRDFDYGDPMIDRPGWERWHEDLKKEKDRREHEKQK